MPAKSVFRIPRGTTAWSAKSANRWRRSASRNLDRFRAALRLRIPIETIKRVQAQAGPVADLVLELTDPAVQDLDGKRRPTAVATLTYIPPDGGPRVESQRYPFTAPIGPIEAEEISWYL